MEKETAQKFKGLGTCCFWLVVWAMGSPSPLCLLVHHMWNKEAGIDHLYHSILLKYYIIKIVHLKEKDIVIVYI